MINETVQYYFNSLKLKKDIDGQSFEVLIKHVYGKVTAKLFKVDEKEKQLYEMA